MSDKKEMKRELFKEEKETMQSVIFWNYKSSLVYNFQRNL